MDNHDKKHALGDSFSTSINTSTDASVNEDTKTRLLKELNIQPLGDITKKTFPENDWIVEDLVPEEAITLLSASEGSYKTWLCLELAKCAASGEKFLGKFKAKQTKVLYLDAECGERLIHKRSNILSINPELPIYYCSCPNLCLEEENVSRIIEACTSNEINLVIFDSLKRFHNADENSAREMSEVFRYFARFKEKKISTLIICHNRKPDLRSKAAEYTAQRIAATSVRGSSDIMAACDYHLAIQSYNNTISIINTKNRFDEEVHPFKAKFTKVSQTKSEWSYNGMIETKEEARDRLKSLVYEEILDSGTINQKNLRQRLIDKGCSLTEKSLSSLLTSLIEEECLLCKNGTRNEKLYYIDDNEGEAQNA